MADLAWQRAHLQHLQQLRTTLEEERTAANKKFVELQAKVASLEKENASLKQGGASASTASAPSSAPSSGKIPFGHTKFSWHGDVGSRDGAPFGHTKFSWHGDLAGTDSAPAAAASVAGASAEKTGEGFMNRVPIKDVLQKAASFGSNTITVCGWARTVRVQGGGKFAFIELNDGSCFQTLQVVVNDFAEGFATVEKNTTIGTCYEARGQIVPSQGAGQKVRVSFHSHLTYLFETV